MRIPEYNYIVFNQERILTEEERRELGGVIKKSYESIISLRFNDVNPPVSTYKNQDFTIFINHHQNEETANFTIETFGQPEIIIGGLEKETGFNFRQMN